MNNLNLTLTLALNFQYEILKKVSRSFALTIPQLPETIRNAVANGYLLCRISDTLEDDISLTLQQKAYFHEKFIQTLTNNFPVEQFIQELCPLLSDQTPIDEKLLILNLNKILYITNSLPENSQKSLKKCVTIMNQGMIGFERTASINGLDSLLALEKYCYIVAGVVGEMLTELFYMHGNFNSKIDHNKLMYLARSFGQALQMTNILKDRWSDLSRNICWLPQDIFNAELKILLKNPTNPIFVNGIKKLIKINFKHLQNALNYVLLLPHNEIGIRRFCLWAIGIAIDTLKNIKKNPDFTKVEQIKISKFKLRKTILITNLIARFNFLLKIWFNLVCLF